MKIDEITRTSLLYDFYGQLLSKRQREVMALYHEENLTLSEIAEEFGISRQGVHDALKNAEKALNEYEEKLGLMEKFHTSLSAVREIDAVIDSVIERLQSGMAAEQSCATEQVVQDLKKVRDIIDHLEE